MIALAYTLPPPAALDADALTDWRAIQATEAANATRCAEDASACLGWSRDVDDVDPESAGMWLAMTWLARERMVTHLLGARVAQAEVTAIRMRCSPAERALLIRRAAWGGAR